MQRFNDAIEEIFKNYYKSNDNMKAVLEKSRKRQAVIFGAGELGHRMYHILKEYGISVKCFCDNLVSGRTDSRTGMEITGLQELKEDIELFFISAICPVNKLQRRITVKSATIHKNFFVR